MREKENKHTTGREGKLIRGKRKRERESVN